MNKYEKLLIELNEEIDSDFSEYSENLESLNALTEASCHKYNDQIHAINSLRQDLQYEISELYKFLKRFGDIGVRITPFEYVTEDSKFSRQGKVAFEHECDDNKSNGHGFVKTAVIASALVFTPVALPVAIISNSITKRSQKKEEYLKKFENHENQKVVWEDQLSHQRDQANFYSTATEIAKLYRALIATVKEAIRETILPELAGVDAFLVADAVKNCIISDANPSDAEIMNISIYKGTAYDMHFVFVKNVFDYYTMIVKFFTEPILSNIVSDNKVTTAEKTAFNAKVKEINEHTKLIESTAVFGG